MPIMTEESSTLLRTALEVAVPLWITEMQKTPWPRLQEQGQACSQIIAEHGDNILYRSKKRGETALAFNALARAIAILAFAPGGVTAFELHFEAKYEGIR